MKKNKLLKLSAVFCILIFVCTFTACGSVHRQEGASLHNMQKADVAYCFAEALFIKDDVSLSKTYASEKLSSQIESITNLCDSADKPADISIKENDKDESEFLIKVSDFKFGGYKNVNADLLVKVSAEEGNKITFMTCRLYASDGTYVDI